MGAISTINLPDRKREVFERREAIIIHHAGGARPVGETGHVAQPFKKQGRVGEAPKHVP
jgi:hypothetical protein